MHPKDSETQIGKESIGVSSDFGPNRPLSFPPPSAKNHLHVPSNSNPHEGVANFAPNQSQQLNRLQIHIPTASEPTFDDEGICNGSPTTQKTNLSTPHKRPIMTQSPPALCHSGVQSPTNNHNQRGSLFTPDSHRTSFSCFTWLAIPFDTKSFLSCKLCSHLCRVRLLGIHLRFLVLMILPLLYFFASSPRRSFVFEFISVVSFSVALLISLNLAIPRFPLIRLLLSRSFPGKITSYSTSKPVRPVVWSIGSKPKAEKRSNSGSWVQVYSNGDMYEGEFHQGKCSGRGVYYFYKSGRYEGDWVDGKYDGYGVETWAKGSRYRGQYRQGLRHGIGVYRFYTGDVYAGEWSNGQCHGFGEYTCEDGSKYVGEFKWGVKHGLGCYYFRNGDRYSGEYFADKIHGFGVYQFGNGHRYEGAWHEGRRQGFGMYSFRSGETQHGHWQNGVLDVASPRNLNTGPSSSVVHVKVLHAVQEALRAAERAHDVAKVEERVNKTLAAANKSANAARVAAVKAVQNRMHHGGTSGYQVASPVLRT